VGFCAVGHHLPMTFAVKTDSVFAFFLAITTAVAPLSGCTLVGAGIGAGIDSMIPGPYEVHAAEEHVVLSHGQRVDLGLRDGRHVKGRYVGVHGPTRSDPETYLLVEADAAVTSVPASELRVIGVEVTGNGWIYGGVIGLTIDVALVIATVIIVENMKFDMTGADFRWGT
jgi:hypothetical protein